MAEEKKLTNFAVQNGSVDICEVIKSYIPILNVRRLSDKATLPKRMFPHSAAYDLFRYNCNQLKAMLFELFKNVNACELILPK